MILYSILICRSRNRLGQFPCVLRTFPWRKYNLCICACTHGIWESDSLNKSIHCRAWAHQNTLWSWNWSRYHCKRNQSGLNWFSFVNNESGISFRQRVKEIPFKTNASLHGNNLTVQRTIWSIIYIRCQNIFVNWRLQWMLFQPNKHARNKEVLNRDCTTLPSILYRTEMKSQSGSYVA